MTLAELDDALDAMQTAAGDADRLPGLITVQTNDWINSSPPSAPIARAWTMAFAIGMSWFTSGLRR